LEVFHIPSCDQESFFKYGLNSRHVLFNIAVSENYFLTIFDMKGPHMSC